MLRDGLRMLLDGSCDVRHVREVAYNGDARDPGLWAELANAGWPGLTVPESAGGAGLGFDVTAAGVRIEAGAMLFEPGENDAAIEELTDELRAVLSAETLGACERLLHMTAEYAKDRQQFGRPIGSYQAVKIRVAQMAG